jgi:hypothetical protein
VKYLVLLWHDESKLAAPGTAAFDQQQAAYGGFFEEASGAGVLAAGDPLQPSARGRTVTVRNGSTSNAAGPFSKGPEQLIGFYVLDCADDNAASTWAAKIPAASSGAVEVRPILSM